MLGESTEVLQPCRLTDQIRPNTAGEKRQQGSKGGGGGRKGKKGRGGGGVGGLKEGKEGMETHVFLCEEYAQKWCR